MSTTTTKTQLECYFEEFRKDIIGINQNFESPFGKKKLFILIGPPVEDYIDRLKKN
jgi:hypothetical protein